MPLTLASAPADPQSAIASRHMEKPSFGIYVGLQHWAFDVEGSFWKNLAQKVPPRHLTSMGRRNYGPTKISGEWIMSWMSTLASGLLSLSVVLAGSASLAGDSLAPITIAVLNDKSSTFSDSTGVGSVLAAELAVEDVGGKVGGRSIRLLGPDHQNKVDLGVSLARSLYDVDHADAIFDVGNSAVSLGIQPLARERGKVIVHVSSATADIFGPACAPTSAAWLNDTYSLAQGLSKSIVQQGGKRWFFITADYAFGHAMEREATKVVTAAGGKVLGAVRHPVGTMDFASFLLQAQQSGADIIAFANATERHGGQPQAGS